MDATQGHTAVYGDTPDLGRRAHAAMDRLTLLHALLDEAGFTGKVMPIGGYPVLFITDPAAPWGVSVGEVNFWLGDPPEVLCRNDRVLEAAWLIAARLLNQPAPVAAAGTHETVPLRAVAPA